MSQPRKKNRKKQAASSKNRSSSRPATAAATKTARRPGAAKTPAAPAARTRLERASAPMLFRLHATPRWLLGVLLGLMLLAGLGLSGSLTWLAGSFLVIIGCFVAWLSALAWPVLRPGARAARVLVSAAIFGMAALKFLGQF